MRKSLKLSLSAPTFASSTLLHAASQPADLVLHNGCEQTEPFSLLFKKGNAK
jgi:hypothetical protein